MTRRVAVRRRPARVSTRCGADRRGARYRPVRDRPAITNVRHIALVERAHEALTRAGSGTGAGRSMSEEFVLADWRSRSARGGHGRRAPEDLLDHIFARFCIGK